jgi:DNA-binding transcriptional LysR family regulator
MQWDDVRYFLILARQGSLSATARLLQVEHSTVARRVTALEKALQLRLFNRLARGWQLTQEGQVLLEKAHALEDEMLALRRTAISSPVLAGRVRLSIPPQMMNYFVLPHLGPFRASYPSIELVMIGERRDADLLGGEVDIALRMAQPDGMGLVSRLLGNVSYTLFGTEIVRNLVQPDQVFIGFDDSIPQLPQKLWLDSHVGTRGYCLRTNDMMAMCQAAAMGWGIALLPNFLAMREGRLKPIATSPMPPTAPVHLLMHHDVRLAPRVRATADFIIQLFQQHQSEL